MAAEQIKNIKCFLFDMDGTVYLGRKLIPGAKDTLNAIRESGKRICFLTNNSSVDAATYVAKLNSLGIDANMNEVYTSGQATCEYLLNHYAHAKIYLMGTRRLQDEFFRYGIDLVEDEPDICVLSYDKELNYEKFSKFCRFIKRGAYYVSTHPDVTCPAEDDYVPDAGSFMKLIEACTGKMPDVICGKPYHPIAEGILYRLGVRAEDTAMVGDRLNTDMRFAANNGFLSILVMTGETTEEMLGKSVFKPNVVLPSIADIKKYL